MYIPEACVRRQRVRHADGCVVWSWWCWGCYTVLACSILQNLPFELPETHEDHVKLSFSIQWPVVIYIQCITIHTYGTYQKNFVLLCWAGASAMPPEINKALTMLWWFSTVTPVIKQCSHNGFTVPAGSVHLAHTFIDAPSVESHTNFPTRKITYGYFSQV